VGIAIRAGVQNVFLAQGDGTRDLSGINYDTEVEGKMAMEKAQCCRLSPYVCSIFSPHIALSTWQNLIDQLVSRGRKLTEKDDAGPKGLCTTDTVNGCCEIG